MQGSLIRPVRRVVGLVWIVLLGALFALVGASHLAPALGHETFIIRGGSMEPVIPLGSLIAVGRVQPESVAPGDIVTVRSDGGTVVTHRVVSIVGADGERRLQLKGDANESADAGLVPFTALVGRVDVFVPTAGYALFLLSQGSGMLAVMSLLAALLLAYWLLEDAEPSRSAQAAF